MAGDLSDPAEPSDAVALAGRGRSSLREPAATAPWVLEAIVAPERERRAVIVTVSPTVEVTRRMRRLLDVRRKRAEPTAAETVPAVAPVPVPVPPAPGRPASPMTNVPA